MTDFVVEQIGETQASEKGRGHLQAAVAGVTRIGLRNQSSATTARMLAGIEHHSKTDLRTKGSPIPLSMNDR